MDISSIVSITLGILSIGLSIWFFVLSNRLSIKTTKAIDEISEATRQLKEMHSKYVEVIFEMFKNDHKRFVDSQFRESELGGKESDDKAKNE